MSLAVERFIDGELAPEQTSAVAAHLQRCPRCRELAQLLGHLKRALRRRTRPRLVAAARLHRFGLRVADHGTGKLWPTST